MKKSSSKKEIINRELAHIIQAHSIHNKLLHKYIDNLDNTSSFASKESQHSKWYAKDFDSK